MDTFLTCASGVRIPRLLYGTAWKKSETAQLVTMALQEGFRGIDTACQPRHYDEAAVGAGIAAALGAPLQRAGLYLQSKFTPLSGQDPARIPYDPGAPISAQVAQSFAASLRNLRTDYLDALLLHSPLASLRDTLHAWRAMEALVESGGVRQLGISNCYELEGLQELCRSVRIRPAVLQNRFYAQTGYDVALRAYCTREGIVYQSFWTLSANPHLLAHPLMQSLARRHRCETPQILFRYLMDSGVVPLTGTRSRRHMREDLGALQLELSEDERREIELLIGG